MSDLSRRELMKLAAAAGLAGPLAGDLLARSALGGGAETGTYDDGSAEVPGGLTGDPERVIVIGAGLGRPDGGQRAAQRGRRRTSCSKGATGSAAGRTRSTSAASRSTSAARGSTGPTATRCRPSPTRRASAAPNGNVELDAPIIRFFDSALGREVDPVDKITSFGHALRFAESDSAAIATELGPSSSVRDGARVYCDREGIQRRPAPPRRDRRPRLLGVHLRHRLVAAVARTLVATPTRSPTYLGLGRGRHSRSAPTAAWSGRWPGRAQVRLGSRVTRRRAARPRRGRTRTPRPPALPGARVARRRHRPARRAQGEADPLRPRAAAGQAGGDREDGLRRGREGRAGLRHALLERPRRTRTSSTSAPRQRARVPVVARPEPHQRATRCSSRSTAGRSRARSAGSAPPRASTWRSRSCARSSGPRRAPPGRVGRDRLAARPVQPRLLHRDAAGQHGRRPRRASRRRCAAGSCSPARRPTARATRPPTAR